MARVVRTPLARHDLKQIGRHIARESGSRAVALGLLDLVHQRMQLHATQPEMGERRPDLELHNVHDGHHPELAGSYLSACVFYAVLTGQSPVGHPCTATQAGQAPVDPQTARFLQEVAWETVQRYREDPAAGHEAR